MPLSLIKTLSKNLEVIAVLREREGIGGVEELQEEEVKKIAENYFPKEEEIKQERDEYQPPLMPKRIR